MICFNDVFSVCKKSCAHEPTNHILYGIISTAVWNRYVYKNKMYNGYNSCALVFIRT